MRIPLFAILAASVPCVPLCAQAAAPAPAAAPASQPAGAAALEDASIDAGEGRAVALKLADQLVQDFVYRDEAEAYAAMLKANAAAGRYDSGTRGDIATRMTDDLMAVHKDGHLHVAVIDRNEGPGASSGPPKGRPPLIQSAKTIAQGIGYIRFTAFAGTDQEVAAVRQWLAENSNAKTLIFDLRNHHGGGLDEQDAIFSYIFARRTPLVRMAISKGVYEKAGFPVTERPSMELATAGDQVVRTHVAVPGSDTPLRKARVYLLVSNKTASAAEHFSLAMKSTHRGTLIGEATAGANHFGGPQRIDEHFGVWMPMGRTYDIKTGKDWEGDGVAPDIAVDPKDALVVALEKAGLSHDQAVKLDAEEVPAEPVHAEKLRAR